jgi:hypothetical protein
MAVANPQQVSTEVTIPAAVETGPGRLVVVTDGHPLPPISITVN